MINAIIFDFGDVFLNLEKDAQVAAFQKLGLNELWTDDLMAQNDRFEKGQMTEQEFLESFQKELPNASLLDIRAAWNTIIGDFPLERLEFLQMLSGKYRLFLLTNTDEIHISWFEHKTGMSFCTAFYTSFEKVLYSYEMGMRKPDPAIYSHIMEKYDLSPKRTLFIDDKKSNTDAAAALGLHVWNLQVGKEDVTELFQKKEFPL
ncbi:HAD family phosphatase [Flavobacterium sp.]|uniref:HAD family hydrolase n=1 Tax=Flavobacterium sp. TaxID=239 RepID=UPI0026241433|nr:HAD family phosphatase [Flavobacterium sp.]